MSDFFKGCRYLSGRIMDVLVHQSMNVTMTTMAITLAATAQRWGISHETLISLINSAREDLERREK
jgi:hypothetical protein